MRGGDIAAAAAAIALVGAAAACVPHAKLRGSVRNYAFVRVGSKVGDDAKRRDAEYFSYRLMPEVSFGRAFRIESHLVMDLISPPGSPALTMATDQTRTYLPLDIELRRTGRALLTGSVDRLNARLQVGRFDLVVGRQAISWGVNTLWPALDLFAPFAPTRIDRDYRPGVDAVRLTISLGGRSEIQAVGAMLGDSLHDDLTAAGLLRFGAGPFDFGLMAGSFHRDTVAGGFVSVGVSGTMVRAEVAWTRNGDPVDRLRRPSFWRGGFGLERQLSSKLNLSVEAAGNAYGETDISAYPLVLASDRMQRGELGGLGRWHAGSTLVWQFHPLGKLANTVVINCTDGSAVWVPWLVWSLSDESEIFLGAQLAVGHPPSAEGLMRSEYGGLASRLLAGFKLYI